MKKNRSFFDRKPIMDIRLFDKSTREKTPEGYLIIDAIATNEGVQEYMRGEVEDTGWNEDNAYETVGVFRPSTVFDNEETRKSAEHKDVQIYHNDMSDPTNYKDFSVGHIISMDGNKAKLIIKDMGAITKIENGAYKEVSLGYDSSWKKEDGEFEGKKYEFVFDSPMMINHIALLREGESRTNAPLLDSKKKTKIIMEDEGMKLKLIDLGNGNYAVEKDGVQEATFTTKESAEKYIETLKVEMEAEAEGNDEEVVATEENEEVAEAEENEEVVVTEENVKPVVKDKRTVLNSYNFDSQPKRREEPKTRVMDALSRLNASRRNIAFDTKLKSDVKGREGMFDSMHESEVPFKGRNIYGKRWYDYSHLVAMYDAGNLNAYSQHYKASNKDQADTILNSKAYLDNRNSMAFGDSEGALRDGIEIIRTSLTATNTEIYEAWYRSSKISKFISAEPTTAGDGATRYEFKFYDVTGEWKEIDNAGRDANVVQFKLDSDTLKLEYSGIDVMFTFEDLRSAVMSGVPLEQGSISAVANMYDMYLERRVLTGDKGLFNNSEITVTAKPVWNFDTSAGKQTIIKDLVSAMSGIIKDTNEAVVNEAFWSKFNTRQPRVCYVALDNEKFDALEYNFVEASNGNIAGLSMMDWIIKHNPITKRNPNIAVEFVPFNKLSGAGATSKDRVVIGFNHYGMASYGEAFSARTLRIEEKGRNIVHYYEAKTTTAFTKIPKAFRFLDIATS